MISPCFNRSDTIESTLLGLAQQSIPTDQFEVIVVDDGSEDRSHEKLQNIHLPYKLIILQQKKCGPASARNLGAENAKGKYYVFLDIDMIPDKNLLASYLINFNNTPQAVIIGRQLPWPRAFSTQFIEIFLSSLSYDLGTQPIHPQYYHLAAGNFAVDKTTFDALGGFDTEMIMGEDVEFGYRAYKRGTRLIYDPQAIGYHNHPKSAEQIYKQSRKSAWWTARLMVRHPEIYESLIYFHRYKPVFLFRDSFNTILRKTASRIYANILTRKILIFAFIVGERINLKPIFAKLINDRIIMGYIYEGFNQGLKDNNWIQREM